MRLNIPIEGTTGEIRQKSIVIRSTSPLRALSSSILNRSYGKFSAIVNTQVPEGYGHEGHAEPKKLFSETVRNLGLNGQTLGLMTAVNANNVSVVSERHERLIVSAVATAGTLNSASTGDKAPEETQPHTINIILLIDANLTQQCMVNAVMIATEAKCAALSDLDIRSSLSSELATGTTSDMIAIACTGRGRSVMFAGTSTKLGELIGSTVRQAVKAAIKKQQGTTPDRPLLMRLEERGIKFDQLLNSALELYSQDFNRMATKEMVQTVKLGLQNALTNPNISALVLAGLRLQEDYHRGLIPCLPEETGGQHSTFLSAGQMLGKTIADSMAGKRGVKTFLKFGKKTPDVLKELEPIASEVFKGLFAGLSPGIPTDMP